MKIMKKWVGALAIVAMCATTSLLFTACGGGDGDSGSSSGGGYSYEEPDYKSQLMGLWSGKGTNWDDATFSVSANFETSTTGWVILSTSGSLTLSNFDSWSASGDYISMSAEKFAAPVTMRITSGSIASGNITVEVRCENDKYNGTVQLKKDSSSGSASTDEQKLGSVSCVVIKRVKTTSGWTYSKSTATCYKTKDSSGRIYLYRNSTYTSQIGKASSNGLSSMGDYNVRSYDYHVAYNVTLNSATYYFFN